MASQESGSGLEHYWALPVEKLFAALHSTPQGLTAAEASARLAQYGPNVLQARRKTSAVALFLNQFKSAIILILLVATGISAITKDWVDALIILVIVVGSAGLSFAQEYRANSAAEKLRQRVQAQTTVLRDGQPTALPLEEVTPGDVVLLAAGSLIPADGVLIESRDLHVNQAVLTGETFPADKQPGVASVQASLAGRTNCVFLGTNVRSGMGRALIVQTGAATAFGQIAHRLAMRPPENEFERGIRRFGYMLTEVMMVLVLIIFAANVILNKPILDSLLFSVALAVGLTPQLLPAIITITLSKGSEKMAAAGVIVRRLASIENFGSMDVLCTDKTGTLTEGVMKLDAALDAQGRASDQVLRYAYLNAHFQTGLTNPLDEAILAQGPIPITQTKRDEIPYDFIRKRLSVVVEEAGQAVLITKGAFESVLAACSQLQEDGEIPALNDMRQEALRRRFAEWSAQGFRVLGVAIKPVAPQGVYERDDEKALIFVGFLLFLDPPKPGVKETIADLARLGVQLKIISGDNRLAAIHTAETIGLPVTGVLTGAEIDNMRDEALWHMAERTTLFAEVDPNEKERIILALKKTGHVVGYMGDGINDAPALHAADVGISVDQAVDVAKEAADLVLLKQDLAVLRQGIIQGRSIFANTLKYVFITTSANFGNMFSMAGASLFLPFLPMLPKQILLTNFLTDFPAINIANDSVDSEWIDRPHRWNTRFITNFMVTFGVISSLFDYITFAVLLLLLHANESQFQTAWFLGSVVTELLILLVIRTPRPLFASKPGRALLLAALAVMVITVAIPFSPLGRLLGLIPLPFYVLLILAGITALYITTNELAKKVFYRKAHF